MSDPSRVEDRSDPAVASPGAHRAEDQQHLPRPYAFQSIAQRSSLIAGWISLMAAPLTVLQYGRALAALFVVLHHSFDATKAFVTPPPQWVQAIATSGYLGLDFFFVLSGFIITHVHSADAYGTTAAARYLGKRCRRIYIPYLPVSIMMIVFYVAFPFVSKRPDDWSVLTSLTLIPTARAPALSVAWTLIHEMIFYLFFLLSYFTRHFVLLVAGWVAAIVLVWACDWVPPNPLLGYFLAPINLELVAGMAAALVAHKLPLPSWPLLLFFGVLGAAAFLLSGADESARVWFGFALVPLVLSLVMLEQQKLIPSIRTMLLLGNASYAIYLVHYPLVAAVVRATSPLQSWPVSFLACLLAGVLAGLVYHWLIEKPGLTSRRHVS
jgi:exopolysaccharide production protein ExoZ